MHASWPLESTTRVEKSKIVTLKFGLAWNHIGSQKIERSNAQNGSKLSSIISYAFHHHQERFCKHQPFHHINGSPYANYHPHRWTPYIDSIRNASYQVNLSALITSPDTVASELKTAIGVAFQPNSDKGKKTPVVKHR